MEHTTIAVDLAKSVFQVAVSHKAGRVDVERRLSRDRFWYWRSSRQPLCSSRHAVRRTTGHARLQPFGHSVRLLPAHDVHRYVRRNKTDRTDTKGLLEAGRNDEIHAVPVKTVDQQAIASLHRLRSTWLATRTARLNTVRGLLREFGLVMPVGAQHVVPQVRALLVESSDLPDLMRPVSRARVTKSRALSNTCARSNASSPRSPVTETTSSCCRPSRAWACSPRRPWWPWSAMLDAFRRVENSRASWG